MRKKKVTVLNIVLKPADLELEPGQVEKKIRKEKTWLVDPVATC
jgi:hypothetical protein